MARALQKKEADMRTLQPSDLCRGTANHCRGSIYPLLLRVAGIHRMMDSRNGFLLFPELTWCHSGLYLEQFGEIFRGVEMQLKGNFLDRS